MKARARPLGARLLGSDRAGDGPAAGRRAAGLRPRAGSSVLGCMEGPPAAAGGEVSLHNFSARLWEQLVHFHVMRLTDSLFLWVGATPHLRNLAVAMCNRYVSAGRGRGEGGDREGPERSPEVLKGAGAGIGGEDGGRGEGGGTGVGGGRPKGAGWCGGRGLGRRATEGPSSSGVPAWVLAP